MDEKIIDRIYQYLDNQNIPPTRFEKEIGLSNGYLNTQRKRNADTGETILQKIVDNCLDIDLTWLITGKGTMIKNNSSSSILKEPHTEYVLKTDRRLADQSIPLYNTQAAAGLTKMFSDPPNVIDHISIPNMPKCDGAIYITGDSMYPLLKSGDIVAYKKINDIGNGILWGEVYLLSFAIDQEDYTMVKYIQKSDLGDDHVKLVSQNHHHQAKDIQLKNITALALIKASIRFNSMN